MSEREHSEPEAAHRDSGWAPAENEHVDSTGTEDNTRRTNPSDPRDRTISGPGRGRRILKWAALIIGLLFFLGVLREAMDPFGDKPYIEISHGDHVHFVPQDRDPNVPMGRFPTTEPAADERITPDGRIVKKE